MIDESRPDARPTRALRTEAQASRSEAAAINAGPSSFSDWQADLNSSRVTESGVWDGTCRVQRAAARTGCSVQQLVQGAACSNARTGCSVQQLYGRGFNIITNGSATRVALPSVLRANDREVYAAASAALALSASIVNVDGSTIAISERIFRSTSIPAFFKPFIRPLYVIPF